MKTKQALNGEFPVARSRLGSGWGGGQRPPPAKRGMFTTVVDPLVTASGLSSSLDADMDAAIDDIAKTGLLLSRGREDCSDFESSVLRLKSTHVADCKPQAPPGRRWDFALQLGSERFLQIKLGPAKS